MLCSGGGGGGCGADKDPGWGRSAVQQWPVGSVGPCRAERSRAGGTMPSYTVTVATGSQWFAGTDDYVYLSLEGTAGCSERHLLDKPFYNDFERGAVSPAGWGESGPHPGSARGTPAPSLNSLRDASSRTRTAGDGGAVWGTSPARRPVVPRQGCRFLNSRPRVPVARSGTRGPKCLLPSPAACHSHPCPRG